MRWYKNRTAISCSSFDTRQMFLRSLGLPICSMMQLLTSCESDWKSFLPDTAAAHFSARIDASDGEDEVIGVMWSNIVTVYAQRLNSRFRQPTCTWKKARSAYAPDMWQQ